MGFDYVCNFNLKDCINTLGIEERGRVQQSVTESVLNLAGPYVPNDVAGKYELPHRLQDSGHIEKNGSCVDCPLCKALVLPGCKLPGRTNAR